ncbi:MAG: hypothetical protein QXQ57_08575 [Sulfolobales archaeon]
MSLEERDRGNGPETPAKRSSIELKGEEVDHVLTVSGSLLLLIHSWIAF